MRNMYKNMTKLYDVNLCKFSQLRLYSQQNHLTNSRELLTNDWGDGNTGRVQFYAL